MLRVFSGVSVSSPHSNASAIWALFRNSSTRAKIYGGSDITPNVHVVVFGVSVFSVAYDTYVTADILDVFAIGCLFLPISFVVIFMISTTSCRFLLVDFEFPIAPQQIFYPADPLRLLAI